MLLDEPAAISGVDRHDILRLVRAFGEQLCHGVRLGEEVPLHDWDIDQVIFCGMGGSAIAGDLLRSYWGAELPVPLIVNRNYGFPVFARSTT